MKLEQMTKQEIIAKYNYALRQLGGSARGNVLKKNRIAILESQLDEVRTIAKNFEIEWEMALGRIKNADSHLSKMARYYEEQHSNFVKNIESLEEVIAKKATTLKHWQVAAVMQLVALTAILIMSISA